MSPEQFPNGNSEPGFINSDSGPEVKEIKKMMGKFTNWSDNGFGILALEKGGTIFCPADALCEHLKPLGQKLVDGEVNVVLVEAEDSEKGPRASVVCCEDHDKK